jgi:hypothetical protein
MLDERKLESGSKKGPILKCDFQCEDVQYGVFIDGQLLFRLRATEKCDIKRVYLADLRTFYVFAVIGDERRFVILSGNVGNQSIDDLYVCWQLEKGEEFMICSVSESIFRVGYSYPVLVVVYRSEDGYHMKFVEIKRTNGLALLHTVDQRDLEGLTARDDDYNQIELTYYVSQEGAIEPYLWLRKDNQADVKGWLITRSDDKGERGMYTGKIELNNEKEMRVHITSVTEYDKTVKKGWNMGRTPIAQALPLEDFQSFAIEIDSRLFLVQDGQLYSPAARNVQPDWNIMSVYYRFRRHILPVPRDSRVILMACIDIGYSDRNVIRSIFGCKGIPGIYERYIEHDNPENGEIRYTFKGRVDSAEPAETRPTLRTFFGNGGLAIGPDCHRSICQLYAGFRYASVVRVYGPGVECRDFEMAGSVFDWKSVEKLRRDMIATYGTLLSIDSNDFGYAVSVLEREEPEKNDKNFRNFMSMVKSPRPHREKVTIAALENGIKLLRERLEACEDAK